MPPQPGVFALPYASTHNARPDIVHVHHHHIPTKTHDDPKRDKKRKDVSGKLGKEMSDRRDEGRHFAENISALLSAAIQLASRPETHPLYNLRMYPLSIERSALLTQLAYEEKHGLAAIETAYEEERERVEEEWRKGRVRVRERLLEGIEERRRRAREEKEGEGAVNDVSLDSQTRAHITRKLRNKLGTSPPPTPLGHASFTLGNGNATPITSGPLTNPHSLSVDEIPSPFPFPLTSVTLPNGHVASGPGNGPNNGNRRRNKGGGAHQGMVGLGGLGKSLAFLGPSKDTEIEADLIEIRRGTKRRRAAAVSSTKLLFSLSYLSDIGYRMLTMSTTNRTFPPLYQQTGDANKDRLAFFHVLERLKTQKRTGWIDHNVPNPESISDHMYRMAVLAMCTSDATLDVSKCVMMCVVHDLAEAQVGDITPREGISKEEKRRLEGEAMHNFVHDMLHASPAALRIEALWKEYEQGVTPEAKFVKDLDRLEMALQAREYEKLHGRDRGDLQGFFDSSLPYLRHPEVRHWGDTLALAREGDGASDVDGRGRGGAKVDRFDRDGRAV